MAAQPDVGVSPSPASYDRVPPHNLDAEISVLGSMLLSRDAIAEVSEFVGPEDFYRGAHRTMFEAIRDLYDRGEPVDPVTLADDLERRGTLGDVGGALAIADLVAKVPTAANALYYARIVADHALRRRLIDVGTQITRLGYQATDGADFAIDTAEALVYQVAQRGLAREFTSMKELLTASFELIERLHEQDSAVTGLATGFVDLDECTAGLQPANLVILAARPAMGKCVSFDTLCLDGATGALRQIGDIVRAGDTEPIELVALGPDLKLRSATPAAFHENGVQPVWRLRTRLGRQIVATANHPFLTTDGWTPLVELAVGDRIATPRALPFFGNDELSDAQVALVAFSIGGESSSGGSSALPTTSSTLIADVQRWACQLGVQVHSRGSSGCPYGLVRRRGRRNRFTDLLRKYGLWGVKAPDKFVPDAFFRLPRRQVALFCNRLFACDGCVYAGDEYAQITYVTVSERLAHQLQHLLLRFGVIAKVRELHHVWDGTSSIALELQVTDRESIEIFASEIGILGKDDQLQRAVALSGQNHCAGDRDLVPVGVGEQVLEAKASRTGCSVSSPQLTTLAESDIYWDGVVSIEPAGEERVYDLTVPGDHNFVAGDLLVHNSTLATNMATHVAVNLRKPAVLFSLEMSQMELVLRILAGEARIDSDRLRTGRLAESDWPKLSQAMGRLAEAPLFIDDTPGINLMEIRSKCRRLKQKHGLDLAVIDYLQLMQPTRRIENRVQEVAELSRGLKILAKELEIPVLALSQLSRKPEDRADRRPQLADLRDSGCLTADTRITRADTGVEVTMGDLLRSGARNVPVWSLDDQLSLVPSVMTHVFSSGSKPVYRVRLASGRTVKATANHPFRAIDGWLPLAELTVGSPVAVPRFLPEPTGVTPWPDGRVAMVAHLVGDGGIPDQICTLPCAQVRLFLRHLWGDDESLAGGDRAMSRRMAEGAQALLLRLGIQSRLKVAGGGEREGCTLDVAGSEHHRRFLEGVGINGAPSAQAEAYPQVETRTDAQGVTPPPGVATMTELLSDQELRCSAESDVALDRIVEVSPLGEEAVYDATVIGTHNFLANGIIVHNSIEQDADIVCFIYRDEVYDKDSSAKGEAELIVAKHRNGPLRTVHLSFLGHHSRFANMARGPTPPNARPGGPRTGPGI
ncbi:MAG: replicative DNA helicase [Egibacteraceae bacterium]